MFVGEGSLPIPTSTISPFSAVGKYYTSSSCTAARFSLLSAVLKNVFMSIHVDVFTEFIV